MNAVVASAPAIVAATVLAAALLVGGSLTQPPPAPARDGAPPRSATVPPIELKLTGLQLPTI